jgi:hypothetical protein
MTMATRLRWDGVAALFLLVLLATQTFAQDYRARVQGVVTDATTAVIPGAVLKLRNTNTGVEARAERTPTASTCSTSSSPARTSWRPKRPVSAPTFSRTFKFRFAAT